MVLLVPYMTKQTLTFEMIKMIKMVKLVKPISCKQSRNYLTFEEKRTRSRRKRSVLGRWSNNIRKETTKRRKRQGENRESLMSWSLLFWTISTATIQ